ncbi:MAG: DNA repair protein RadC [Chloroflexi bacterium]|nr:DNA repair protein RadC [Chloroflexota bacterium]
MHPENPLHSASDADLLTILLGAGNSPPDQDAPTVQHILDYLGHLPALTQISAARLAQMTGQDEARLMPIFAAVELGKRLYHFSSDERPVIRGAEDAARVIADMAQLPQEQVRLILLDVHNRVIAVPTLYIGTLHGVVIRVAEIVREAVMRNSPAFILAHNHPSGDPAPSPEDIELTRMVIAAGKLLDIQLLDHIIISQRGWLSLKQQGLGFPNA